MTMAFSLGTMKKMSQPNEDIKSQGAQQENNRLLADLKKCPQCGVLTIKNGGCDAMKCPRCKTKWCWACDKTSKQLKAHRHRKDGLQ